MNMTKQAKTHGASDMVFLGMQRLSHCVCSTLGMGLAFGGYVTGCEVTKKKV